MAPVRPADLFLFHHTVKMADNLNIKGIREDEPHERGRAHPHGKHRKTFVVESRIVYPENEHPNSVFRTLGLGGWWVHGRYATASRRDQAYAALVKKEATSRIPRWGHWEFRKRND